jgi:hypothetical protein
VNVAAVEPAVQHDRRLWKIAKSASTWDPDYLFQPHEHALGWMHWKTQVL